METEMHLLDQVTLFAPPVSRLACLEIWHGDAFSGTYMCCDLGTIDWSCFRIGARGG